MKPKKEVCHRLGGVVQNTDESLLDADAIVRNDQALLLEEAERLGVTVRLLYDLDPRSNTVGVVISIAQS